MQQRILGTQGFTTSALGLGCMGFSQGYGAADDDESLRAIAAAVDAGITMLDTAMTYGRGHNEQLIGRYLAARPGGAKALQIATKFGIVRGADGVGLDARPEHVTAYCDASLQRLGVDVIDLYYLHRADPDVPVSDSIGAIAELVSAGKVRYVGVSELTPEQLEQAAATHPISAVQFEWSLLWREPENDVVPTARKLGIGLVPYSPLGRGLLTATLVGEAVDSSDFRRNDQRFQGENLAQNLTQVQALHEFAAARGITAGQLALAWLLAQGPDVVPIPGSRRAERVAENAAAATIELSANDLSLLEDAVPNDAWVGDRQSFAVPTKVRTRG